MGLSETYRYLMDEVSDPRVAHWPLLKSPLPVTLILISYLVFVLHLGPFYMRNRKPYTLNNVMLCYNLLIATASGIVFYGLLTSGYTTTLSWGCEPLKISYDAESLSMARWVWWLLALKICELGDTVIFMLRKKYNQMSFLHLYHHVVTVILSWITCKYAPGGMWTFILMPNCVVHVIMYGYYLLASLGPNVQRRIAPWKSYVTRLQLFQFVIMVVHTSQTLMPDCEPSRKPLAYIYMSQVVIIFGMFCNFYKRTYLKKKKAIRSD